MDVDDVTLETFEGREGQTFSIQFADLKVELTLESAERMPEEWGQTDRRVPFTIHLLGPLDRLLPQLTYPLDHEELGRTDVFLVPLGPVDDAMRYEAVFT